MQLSLGIRKQTRKRWRGINESKQENWHLTNKIQFSLKILTTKKEKIKFHKTEDNELIDFKDIYIYIYSLNTSRNNMAQNSNYIINVCLCFVYKKSEHNSHMRASMHTYAYTVYRENRGKTIILPFTDKSIELLSTENGQMPRYIYIYIYIIYTDRQWNQYNSKHKKQKENWLTCLNACGGRKLIATPVWPVLAFGLLQRALLGSQGPIASKSTFKHW